MSLLTDQDFYLFNEGSHRRLFEKLGAHPQTVDGTAGTNFAVWAPNAERVSVTGGFNGWNKESHRMDSRGGSGVWELFIPHVQQGESYKFHVESRYNGYRV